MGNRAWQGAIAGIVAAVVSWVASYPFLPEHYVDLNDPKTLEQPIETHFTLGTFYGWFSNGLFGLLATLLIVMVYTARMPFRQRVLPCLIACALGALWVAGGDALSDAFCIWLDHQAWDVALSGLLVAPLIWAFVMSVALCSAIVVSMALRMDLIGRLFLAIGICTAACIVLRMVVGSVTDVFTFAMMANSSSKLNLWQATAPAFLASDIALGASAGACLAVADIVSRKAWVRLSLGAKEGYTWTVDGTMIVGTSEAADIRLPRNSGALPRHAQIEVRGQRFFLRHLGGSVPVLVNNVPVQAVELNDGDVIRLGASDLVFHVRNARQVPAASAAASAYAPQSYVVIDPLGNSHRLQNGKTTIGRDPGCSLPMPWEPSLSSVHAELSLLADELTVRDLGSTNGTKVNGTPIGTGPVPIKGGDRLELGSVKLIVQSNGQML